MRLIDRMEWSVKIEFVAVLYLGISESGTLPSSNCLIIKETSL